MTSKTLGSVLFLFATACSASVDGMHAGDDEGPGTGGPGVGNDDIRFRLTAVHDERADQITFATGEPVHAHAGPTVQLGSSDCPDVYKFGYLMAAEAPVFGRETAPNPLRWEIDAKAAAEYRVRAGDDTTLQDWRAVDGTEIELRREVVTSGKHLLDVRVGASVATTCFILHPLAAPLEAPPAAPAADGLPAMTFAAASPISRLFRTQPVPVFVQPFAHHTAEAVELTIDASAPVATFSRRAVDEYVQLPTVANITLCSNAQGDTGEAICTLTPPAMAAPTTETANGPLATGTWTLQILDEATNAPATNCSITNLRATCKLAPRTATGASQHYRAVLGVAQVGELVPYGTALTMDLGEHTLLGRAFTGRILDTQKHCAEIQEITKFGVTLSSCIKETHYTRIQAMDTASIAFAPVSFAFATTPRTDIAPIALAPHTIAAFTWDAGDADLPGPQ